MDVRSRCLFLCVPVCSGALTNQCKLHPTVCFRNSRKSLDADRGSSILDDLSVWLALVGLTVMVWVGCVRLPPGYAEFTSPKVQETREPTPKRQGRGNSSALPINHSFPLFVYTVVVVYAILCYFWSNTTTHKQPPDVSVSV